MNNKTTGPSSIPLKLLLLIPDLTISPYLYHQCVPGLLKLPGNITLIYKNDLPNISDVPKFYLFTDDTNIYESESLSELGKTINEEKLIFE